MGEVVKHLRARLRKAAKEQKAKTAKLAAIPLPDFTPLPSFVAFIDILGFGPEIQRAKTKEQLQQAYAKIKLVQKEFQKPSATDDPEEQSGWPASDCVVRRRSSCNHAKLSGGSVDWRV
jgi:hypothetical protein